MISKTDVILLLTELQMKGINVDKELAQTLNSSSISLEVLKTINDNRQLDVYNFYQKLRQSYNNKKSKLYINIMKADESALDDPRKVLTTLSAMMNQILQFKADDQPMFYEHSRCNEILKVLNIYFKSFNLEPALKLLALIKADIKALESLS